MNTNVLAAWKLPWTWQKTMCLHNPK